MSCDWDVYCVDCEKRMGLSDWNHADAEVLSLCKAASILAVVAALDFGNSTWVEFSLAGRRVDLSFFAKHLGHRLVPRSEYGEILDACGKDIVCDSCKHRAYEKCRKSPGHDGPCTNKLETQ